jgi:hypothetical protein
LIDSKNKYWTQIKWRTRPQNSKTNAQMNHSFRQITTGMQWKAKNSWTANYCWETTNRLKDCTQLHNSYNNWNEHNSKFSECTDRSIELNWMRAYLCFECDNKIFSQINIFENEWKTKYLVPFMLCYHWIEFQIYVKK